MFAPYFPQIEAYFILEQHIQISDFIFSFEELHPSGLSREYNSDRPKSRWLETTGS